MLRWLSNKASHSAPVRAPKAAYPNKTASAKGDEEFAYYPGLDSDNIEVKEMSINEFLHHFKK